MDYSGLGQWKVCSYDLKLLPVDYPFMAAATQPIPPSFLSMHEYNFQCLEVASDPIILVVSSQLRAQLLMLMLYRIMTVIAAPVPQPFHGSSQPFSGRLLLNSPLTTT